ncbi:MAG: hypothetical protein AB8B91_07615 [Rubripirellula sp.]
MTSQSRRKRRITARTFNRAIRLSLSLALAASTVGATQSSAFAQNPTFQRTGNHNAYSATANGYGASLQGTRQTFVPPSGQNLQRVPRHGSQVPQATRASAQPNGWDLKWRKSTKATAGKLPTQQVPQQVPQVAATVQLHPIQQTSYRTQVAPAATAPADPQLQVANTAPALRPVAQATWMSHPQRSDELVPPPSTSGQPSTDIFNNPFGDDSDAPSIQETPAAMLQQDFRLPDSGDLPANPTEPNTADPANELRGAPQNDTNLFDQLRQEPGSNDEMTLPEASPTEPSAPADDVRTVPQDDGPSLGDMLRENQPDVPTADPPAELPTPKLDRSDDREFDSNPFERLRGDRDADRRDRDRLNSGEDAGEENERGFGFDDEDPKPKSISCADFRERIRRETIDQVSLDISPPYRPDEIDLDRYMNLKRKFDEKQTLRQWRSLDGRELASGRLRDLAYEKVVVETEFGTLEELPYNRLSEADLAYLSENWGLPGECLLDQVAYKPRNWASTTMTWKASNLCHTPLYFEDVNLERYGHTRGPLLEPVVQSAHFFASIAVLPYKMGVHGPTECQYALGYYRPGNCAPWIKPPMPLSARGAIAQAATMTGLFWLIP